jgi:hypothetical protein
MFKRTLARTGRFAIKRPSLHLEQLETRVNPSTPTLFQTITLPGANTVEANQSAFVASPITADIFGTGQQEVIAVGGDGNLYAYQFNKSSGQYQQVVQYFTGPGGQGVTFDSTPIVVNLPSGLAVFAANVNGLVFGWNAATGAILPGWPQTVAFPGEVPQGVPFPNAVNGSIAAGDLENNGNPDIVVTSFNHEVTAFHSNGSVFWRFNNDDTIFSGVAIGDLNRDGRLEVVVGGDSSPSNFYWAGGRINCLSWQGKREWVVQTNEVIWSTPVLADLRGNGDLDVIVGTGIFYGPTNNAQFGLPSFPGNEVYAIDPNGNMLPGWPFVTAATNVEGRVQSSPTVADLFGNGQLEVVFADFAGNLYAVNSSGQQIWKTAAYPGIGIYSGPLVGPDSANDGSLDIFMGASAGGPNGVTLQEFDGHNGQSIFSFPGNNSGLPIFPMFNSPAIGHFTGDSSFEMAVSFNNYTSSQLDNPSTLQFFNLGTSDIAVQGGQLRQEANGDGFVRSSIADTSLIKNLYQGALHRGASAGEISNIWLPLFAIAPSLQPLISAIVTSTEARSDEINGWYTLYLNRPADPGGLRNWLGALASGATWASVQANIVASQEAFNGAGGTNAAWVTYLYQKVLGRTPSQGELNGWVNPLNAGTITRPQVAFGFLLSREFTGRVVDYFYATYKPNGLTAPPADDLQAMGMDLRAGRTEESALVQMLTSNGDYVSMQQQGSWVRALYQDVLDRQPGSAETAAWLGAFEAGASYSAIANAIVSSSEANSVLLSTPQVPGGTQLRVGQIQGYYQKLLGRTPSAGEVQGWVNALGSGTSRNTILLDIVASSEYFTDAGGTALGFINKAFNDLLGRPPAANNISLFVNDPNLRVDVPMLILFNVPNEFNTDTVVNSYFNAYLDRFPNGLADSGRISPPGNAGGQGFIDQLNAGVNPITIQVEILSSAEFLSDALYKQFWLGGGRWLG